jgi:hypothetical protein
MGDFASFASTAASDLPKMLGASSQSSSPSADQVAARDALYQQQYADQQQQNQNLLERTMAEQRARLGAMGIASSGGSGDALMAGLTQSNAEDRAARTRAQQVRWQGLYGDGYSAPAANFAGSASGLLQGLSPALDQSSGAMDYGSLVMDGMSLL